MVNRVRDRVRGVNRVRNWHRVRAGGERVTLFEKHPPRMGHGTTQLHTCTVGTKKKIMSVKDPMVVPYLRKFAVTRVPSHNNITGFLAH